MPVLRLITWSLVALIGLAAAAEAQTNRSLCADCHFSAIDAPAEAHLDAWANSPHGRSNVGCERCHGGNPATTDRFPAHQGILRSTNPSSPVHEANLPRTCGTCHAGPFVEFQKSRHFELLAEGDRRGPTCTTCHDAVAATLVSPRGLEQRCNQCHGPRGREPRAGRAAEARSLLEGIVDLRTTLAASARLVGRVADPKRRGELDDALIQAQVPLTQARDAGHRFVFDELQARMATARDRATRLMQLLVNPRP